MSYNKKIKVGVIMFDYKKIIMIINRNFILEFLIVFVPFLLIFLFLTQKAIILILIEVIIALKQYFPLRRFKKEILENKEIIDKELTSISFRCNDYILTNNFLFDLKYCNIINYKNIYGVLKRNYVVLDPINSHINDVIYVLTKRGILKLTIKDPTFNNNEKDYKYDFDKFLKEKNSKIVIDSSDKLKFLLEKQCRIQFNTTWRKTWYKNKCKFCFFN